MARRLVRILAAWFGLVAFAAGSVALGMAGPAAATPTTLYVGCSIPGSYSSIETAVTNASTGDTILVCSGTYHEEVVIPASKSLTLQALGAAVIDASGQDNGVLVLGSGSKVQGFTVENAIGEGILVQGTPGTPVTDVSVVGNVVEHNDQGNPTGSVSTTSTYPECEPTQGVPGDCGEGIHLMVAADSIVVNNHVSNNSGGILLTDEFGPTDRNLIEYNQVTDNLYDCGITLAGHNLNNNGEMPVGGVYDNTVSYNSVTDNGVAGQGAGVLLATALPGGAVYDNVVQGNYLEGNGLAGVTVHSHATPQNLNGNVVVDNVIGTNNLDGDFDFYPYVDPDHTAVFVGSAGPLSITVTDNVILNNTYGIWTTPDVSVTGAFVNAFVGVTTPVFQNR